MQGTLGLLMCDMSVATDAMEQVASFMICWSKYTHAFQALVKQMYKQKSHVGMVQIA